MKKQLLLLGLVTGGAIGLASCGNSLFKEVAGPHDIDGHKLVDKLEDGKQYYMGVYDEEIDDVRFVNGDQHRDDRGVYPFYMAKNDEGGLDNAAKVEVKFTDSTHFKLLVHTPEDGMHWSDKYITLYTAESSYGNNVVSIHAADEDETSFVDQKGNTCNILTYEFEWLESYAELPMFTIGFKYQDERNGEEEPMFRVFGSGIDGNTGSQYKSVDCKHIDKALEEYWVVHFFEA